MRGNLFAINLRGAMSIKQIVASVLLGGLPIALFWIFWRKQPKKGDGYESGIGSTYSDTEHHSHGNHGNDSP
jgi:hypothetical protein